MMRNKKLRTVFCGILIFLLVFALFCLGDYGIRYYHTTPSSTGLPLYF